MPKQASPLRRPGRPRAGGSEPEEADPIVSEISGHRGRPEQ
jgi:hypothetical protein